MNKEYYIKSRAYGGSGGNLFGQQPNMEVKKIQFVHWWVINAIREINKEGKVEEYGKPNKSTETPEIETGGIKTVVIEVEAEAKNGPDKLINRIGINDTLHGYTKRDDHTRYTFEIPKVNDEIPKVNDWQFLGFHGKCGDNINSLGIYVKCPPFKDDKANTYYRMIGNTSSNKFSEVSENKIKEITFWGDNAISGIAFNRKHIGSKSGKTDTLTLPDNISKVRLIQVQGALLGFEFINAQGQSISCKKNNLYAGMGAFQEVPYEFSIPAGFRLAGFYGFGSGSGISGLGLIIRQE